VIACVHFDIVHDFSALWALTSAVLLVGTSELSGLSILTQVLNNEHRQQLKRRLWVSWWQLEPAAIHSWMSSHQALSVYKEEGRDCQGWWPVSFGYSVKAILINK
jgi:hypothetical protein